MNRMQGFSADSELLGYDYKLALKLSDYLPISCKITDHYHVGVTAIAFYFNHRLGKTTETIQLPGDGGTIDHVGLSE